VKQTVLRLTSPEDAAGYRARGWWKDTTLFERFHAAAIRQPGKTALIMGAHELTYADAARLVDNIAGNLFALGIQRGEVVAVQLPNSIELPLIHLALNRIGALLMPMHDSFRELELTQLLALAGASAAVIPHIWQRHDYPSMYAAIRAELPSLRHVFSIGGGGPHSTAFETLLEPSTVDPRHLADRRPDPDDIAHIMLSSGTTALPKISVFTNNNLLSMMESFVDMTHLTAEDVAAALAPMGTGATGYVYPVLPPLLCGGTAVILERWSDPEAAVELIVANQCTCATAIPTQMILLTPSLAKRSAEDFARFRCFNNAGAPLPEDVAAEIERLMGCRIQTVYGSTDGGVCCMTSIDDPAQKRRQTVGRVLPGRRCELRDPQGMPVAAGEVGEICWQSPDKSFGYLNDLEASKKVFDEQGFYHSGDLGSMDSEGYVRIVGRLKDMILRGGRNISPRLIEDHLVAHPAVREVAVAAMPHAALGEQACAFVTLAHGQRLDFESMIAFLRERNISVWQLPERLEVMDELPRSVGGKIAKNKLTEWITAKIRKETAVRE
jgi:non-ribosomal peptide synthetase component E (peptide arylation enzyme)